VETLGKRHWRGTPCVDDTELRKSKVDRIYDVFARESDFEWVGAYLREFAEGLADGGPYSTREFLYLLGQKLRSDGKEPGILTTAAEKKVPIYCPGLSDSSIGIELAVLSKQGARIPVFNIIKDVEETAEIVVSSKKTGVVYVGGGVPKNFIQQTQVTLAAADLSRRGHDYALQIITDPPYWGGLSGCTFDEAQSWGKIALGARKVTVYCDATIVLPLLACHLRDTCSDLAGKERISFTTDADLGFVLK
jgi:deoxyhypusine synthase